MDIPPPQDPPNTPALAPSDPAIAPSADRPEDASADDGSPRRRRITVLGNYHLGNKLGAGAMGAVYRARQISTDRPAAVKELRPHLAKNRLFLQRFLREAQVMASLSPPNIVRCYAMGKQHGRHYLAMEL